MNRAEHDGAADFDDALHDLIVGVDGQGGLYPIEKLDAHRTNTQHMAVSIFLFQGDRLLLQQRAAGKYHAPLLWANSACSHPRWGETAPACVDRTLLRELGLVLPTSFVRRTAYETKVGALYENEVVDCYRGTLPGNFVCPDLNPDETAAVRLAGIPAISSDVAARPERYAPWFRIYVETGILHTMA